MRTWDSKGPTALWPAEHKNPRLTTHTRPPSLPPNAVMPSPRLRQRAQWSTVQYTPLSFDHLGVPWLYERA
ncbi:hypothetical protein JCM16814_22850 [Desulfobaculum senezii]